MFRFENVLIFLNTCIDSLEMYCALSRQTSVGCGSREQRQKRSFWTFPEALKLLSLQDVSNTYVPWSEMQILSNIILAFYLCKKPHDTCLRHILYTTQIFHMKWAKIFTNSNYRVRLLMSWHINAKRESEKIHAERKETQYINFHYWHLECCVSEWESIIILNILTNEIKIFESKQSRKHFYKMPCSCCWVYTWILFCPLFSVQGNDLFLTTCCVS